MYNQTKVQVVLVAIALLFVVLGDRMAALAAILTYAIVEYIAAKHYREAHASYGVTQTAWLYSLTAYLLRKKEVKKHDNSLPYAAGVLRGIEIIGYTNFIVEIPNGEDPKKPKTVVLKREVELVPGETHQIPVYRVSPTGTAPVGTAVSKPTGAATDQKQLF
jgi:hypothetical protein